MADGRRWRAVGVASALVGLAVAGMAARGMVSLRADPLAAQPFVDMGMAALQAGQMARANSLLAEAERRDPHDLAPRVGRVAMAAQTGSLRLVGSRLENVALLDADTAAKMAQRLAARVPGPEEAGDLARALGHAPGLAAATLAGMGGAARDGGVVSAFVGALPPKVLHDPELRRVAAIEFARLRDYVRARAFWPGPNGVGPVYSPDFADLSAPPPFGWQVMQSPAGAAEKDPQGGVALSAYGRDSGVLLGQMLTLAPGAWRIGLTYQALSPQGGVMALRLRCVDDGAVINEKPLEGGDGERVTGFVAQVPPERCEGQWLEVVARPVDGQAHQDLRALRMKVAR